MAQKNTLVRETLKGGEGIPIHGYSMLPLLREGKDTVILKDFNGSEVLNIGEVILFGRGEKKVLHRIIGIENEILSGGGILYIVRGDNCVRSEIVKPEQILAVMTGFVKKGKTVSTDDGKYQKYVRKTLKRSAKTHKRHITLCNYVRKIKRFISQDSLHIYDNGQYLYNTGSSKAVLKQLSEDHHKKEEPRLRVIENGIVLPRKRFVENGNIIDRGGVIDRELNYIEESTEYDFGGKYDFDLASIQKSEESVIYLGRAFPHYGVILIDFLRRAYFKYSEEGKTMKVCFCGVYCEPGTFGKHDKKSWELLSAIGLSREDMIDVRAPTQFKKVYIPEPGFEYERYYHDEFRIPYKALYDKVEAKSFKNVYLSRGKIPQKKETGEAFIEKFFRINGFYVLYPDEAHITEQVQVLKGAECIASVQGTGAYNILFCTPGTKQIIIRRDTRIEPRHFLFNELMQSPAVYIDCYFNFLPGFPRHYDIGPFCMLFNKNIRMFAKDNGYKIPRGWFANNVITLIKYCLLCIDRVRAEKRAIAMPSGDKRAR